VTGTFTLSVDVEGLWGLFFVRSYVDDPSAATAGRAALPRMLQLLAERRMRATFAFVGHLLLDRCGPWKGEAHPGAPRPRYPWYDRDWYSDDPGGSEDSHPLWYARSQALATAAAGHDVGAHGFAHAILDPSSVGADVADAEFSLAQ
jgi:peptidoglycan/xylan/chitin deacetylase (PgdA/CDA1 family)